jgi:hypothetical protein
LRTRLSDATTQLATFQVEQSATAGAACGETSNHAAHRRDIYVRFMRPIARIMKASLRSVGEYEKVFLDRACRPISSPSCVRPSRNAHNAALLGHIAFRRRRR